MIVRFAPPDPEYDRWCLRNYSPANVVHEMDGSWEESGQFWTPPVVWDDAFRLKLQPLIERFKRWFYPDGWNRLFGISSRPLDLTEYTKTIWSKRLNRAISNEEAMEIIRPFRSFLSLMREIRANGK